MEGKKSGWRERTRILEKKQWRTGRSIRGDFLEERSIYKYQAFPS